MLYIRTDMNSRIATGHLMRCLAIAEAANESGEEVTFLLADEQAVSCVQERGFQSIVLKTDWKDMESELKVVLKVIKKYKISSLLVDSYQVTEHYLSELSKSTKVIYLDDLNRFLYPVQAIVCYANYYDKFEYSKRYFDTKLLLGTKYMPLRKAFSEMKPKEIVPKAERFLILSGGTDRQGIMERILGRLNISKWKKVTVICGKFHDRYSEFVEKYQNHSKIHILQNVSNIEEYMSEADLAVSAGGTTLYELCACGTPSISYLIADNQLENVTRFSEDGIIDYAGDIRTDDVVENVIRFVDEYCENRLLREQRSAKMKELIDGKGAKRIVEAWKEM